MSKHGWRRHSRFPDSWIVFDRFRIAHFADACLGSKNDELSQVDGREQFRDVEAWVEATLEIPGFMESA